MKLRTAKMVSNADPIRSKGENARALLAILQDHASTVAEREVCARLFREAAGNELVLAGALYDGLAYGNWPWPSRQEPTEEKRVTCPACRRIIRVEDGFLATHREDPPSTVVCGGSGTSAEGVR